ncbi:CoA transferase [Mycolicibacterium sp.]|uniref:CoA transferase n=1 Tax=Mycolicibacterium sp. TaxID=2320850 RepID=UPI003D0BC192
MADDALPTGLRVLVWRRTPRQWRATRAWLGKPDRFSGPEFDTIAARFAASPELDAAIAELFAPRTAADAIEHGQRLGVPIAVVLTPAEALVAKRFRAVGTLTDVELTPGATVPITVGPLVIDGRPHGYRCGATAEGSSPAAARWWSAEPLVGSGPARPPRYRRGRSRGRQDLPSAPTRPGTRCCRAPAATSGVVSILDAAHRAAVADLIGAEPPGDRAGPTNRAADVAVDAQLVLRGLCTPMAHPLPAAVVLAGTGPAPFTRIPLAPLGPVPMASEHTRVVCQKALGLAAVEVDALIAAGGLSSYGTTQEGPSHAP